MHETPDIPEVLVLFPDTDNYHRLRCECGCNHVMVVQEGSTLKSNIQIMSIQCVECKTVLSFHPESSFDGWKSIN